MQGKANFFGHPLHVVSIAFPVAFWSGAAIADLLAWRSGDPFWSRMSLALIQFGNVTGFIACVPGFIDLFTMTLGRKVRAITLWHAAFSTLTLGCFVFAHSLRSAGGASTGPGMALTWAGDAALVASGYFGSELVARYALGVRVQRGSSATISKRTSS